MKWARPRTADAIQELVQTAVLQIRTMAYLREGLGDGPFPNIEYQEQIRLLADICDTLIPGLGSRRHYSAQRALQYTWESRNEEQREWIRRTLHGVNIHVEELLTQH
jgi:hypothetical protein